MQDQSIYQLYLWIKDVTPLIWRRFLINSETTLADLHHMIQISMGWSDTYLHQFIIHGKSYGIYHEGGLYFADDPTTIYLRDFQFRLKERFIYKYNFYDDWQIEVRLEKKSFLDLKKKYPLCIAASYVAPPEDCGGAERFMTLADYYSVFYLMEQLCALLEALKEEKIDLVEFQDQIEPLLYWASRNHFDRQQVNRELQHYVLSHNLNSNKDST